MFINSVVVCFHLPWFHYAFALIDMDEELTKVCEDVIEEFAHCLYGVKGIKSVNEARYQMFFGKKKMPEPQKLSPTKECLSLHLDRANFVVRVWKLSLETHPLKLNPPAQGWTGGNQGL